MLATFRGRVVTLCKSAVPALIELFVRQKSGNVAITFALATIPLVLSVGAAIDYTAASKARVDLNAYADAAALQAVSKGSMSLSTSTAQENAIAFFKAQAATMKTGSLGTVSATVSDNTSGRAAVVNYTATVPTTFMGVAGMTTIDVAGTATANSAVPTYIDFYLLLDNTPSMGVGATPADVAKMVANTSDKCAFACHQLDVSPNDYYGLAKKLGVTTRIDVVRSATQQLMDTAAATQTVSNQYRMAIYTFGESAKKAGLTKIFTLSSNLSSAKSAASAIDLMTVPYQNYASDTDTNFDDVLPDMNKKISAPGDLSLIHI